VDVSLPVPKNESNGVPSIRAWHVAGIPSHERAIDEMVKETVSTRGMKSTRRFATMTLMAWRLPGSRRTRAIPHPPPTPPVSHDE
jgi:hypothetical protein